MFVLTSVLFSDASRVGRDLLQGSENQEHLRHVHQRFVVVGCRQGT